MNPKSTKTCSSSRLYTTVRGSLGRIAKRRYTRDLFDDIVDSLQSNSENMVSDEEKLLTLFKCFNNFFNKKFDSERMFKAISYTLIKEHSKIIMSWLKQKKADNIYVIGRFILHVTSFLEDQTESKENQVKECGNLLNLIFTENNGILDENFILIFSFLSRKGYFRSIIGFILKHFKEISLSPKLFQIQDKQKLIDMTAIETWIKYLMFPLIFAVRWRIKVEDWIKSEAEKQELYGSTESIDDDYANTSIMNMSLMSVSSEYSTEDPHSRQTRLFLKRLISSWCNSVYFNDSFYQYSVSHASVTFANNVLINSVPIYLIILAIVEPSKQKRKYSIESFLSNNKTLLVLYKLNSNPSLGLLSLLVCGICGNQQIQAWKNVGQEEAYGIIVCLHLTMLALFDQIIYKDNMEKNKLVLSQMYESKDVTRFNENYKLILSEIKECISENINQLLKISFTGLLDPDVVLPLAYLYQNLRKNLKLSKSTILGCRMILSKNVAFMRYLWSLCQQAVTSREISFSSGSSERRTSDFAEKSIIFKVISDGRMISIEDFHRFISILSTILECVTFHLNTLYQAETRRKSSPSYGASPAAVCSNFLLWPELWNMTSELATLSIGLIKIAVSSVNLKEIDISENHCQSSINLETKSASHQETIIKEIQSILRLLRIFYIHIDKLNTDYSSIDEILMDFDFEKLRKVFSKEQIESVFDETELNTVLKKCLDLNSMKINELIPLLFLKYLPTFFHPEMKIMLIETYFALIKQDFKKSLIGVNHEEKEVIIQLPKDSILKDILSQVINYPTEFWICRNEIILNNEINPIPKFILQILNEGLDPVNHLFSCDGNQLLYPNPYVENFYSDFKVYYEYFGKIFALNILHQNGLKQRFSPFFLEKLIFLNESVYNINDLNTVDMEVAKNLLLLSKTDDELDCFNFKFVLTQNTFGKLHTYEIVENGAQIPVTKDNKNEYIHDVIEFLLDKQIKVQCEQFKKGMESVISTKILSILSTNDLHKLISGNHSKN